MSFRELRNFTEIMRNLGYPGKISVENFRVPNFVLVYEVLFWLVQRYDPNVDIPDAIGTEQERVVFLRSVSEVLYYKARLKLNLKRLYQADGFAVKELLKLAKVVNDATTMAKDAQEGEDQEAISLQQLNSSKFQLNVKQIRSMATELTEVGAEIHELLGKELELRQERLDCISIPHNMDNIKEHIERKNNEAVEMISELTQSINNLKRDEDSLKEKKKRKETELERAKKRLSRVSSFRPAFMDEYEQKEKELQELYKRYVEKYRNIEYLEHELEKHRREEAEIIEENKRKLKQLRKRLQDIDMGYLRGENQASMEDSEETEEIDENSEEEEETEESDNGDTKVDQKNQPSRPRAASGRRPEARQTQVIAPNDPKQINNKTYESSGDIKSKMNQGKVTEENLDGYDSEYTHSESGNSTPPGDQDVSDDEEDF
ncbi:hypothetical protein ABK040_000614 [Willaertia magna]